MNLHNHVRRGRSHFGGSQNSQQLGQCLAHAGGSSEANGSSGTDTSTLGASGSQPIYVARSVLGRTSLRPLHEVSVLLERYNQVFTIESLYCDPEDYDAAAAALLPLVDGVATR